MSTTNTTLSLIDMMVAKHNLDRRKVINYIAENGNNRPFKLVLSGLLFELSVNANNIKTQLS